MCRFSSKLCSIMLLLAASIGAGEGIARPDLPEWALGVVAFKQIGQTIDKAGAYASKVVPNSSDLAKQALISFVFKFPVYAGLKNDAPGFIYWLDPVATGLKDGQVYVLPISDATAAHKSLTDSFGAPAEEDGVLTFSLPQPLPNPDKTLVVRIQNERVIVAPNLLVLKTVETHMANTKPEVLLGDEAADVCAALKVANFKRNYEGLLTASMDAGAAMAADNPEQAAALKEATRLSLLRLWDLDFVQLKVNFDAAGADAQLQVTARDKTDSAAYIHNMQGSVTDAYLNLLSGERTFFVMGMCNGNNLATTLRELQRYRAKNPTAQQAGLFAFIDKIGELGTSLTQELKIAFSPTGNDPSAVLAVRPDDMSSAVVMSKTSYEQLAGMIQDEINRTLPAGAPKAVVKMELIEGDPIQTMRLDMPFLAAHPNADLEALIRLSAVRLAPLGQNLLVAFGPGGVGALETAVENHKDKTPAAAQFKPLTQYLKTESCFVSCLRPVGLTEWWLNYNKVPMDGKLFKDLDDSAVIAAVDAKNNTATLRVNLPSALAGSMFSMFLRLQRAGIDLQQVGVPKKEDVPAPPPPKEAK